MLLLLHRCSTTAAPHPRSFGQSNRGNAFRLSGNQNYGFGYQEFQPAVFQSKAGLKQAIDMSATQPLPRGVAQAKRWHRDMKAYLDQTMALLVFRFPAMGRLSNLQQFRAWRDENSEDARKLIELELNEQGLRMRMGGEVEERNTNEDAIP